MARLSELEGATLGEIRTRGPCTAYAARQAFKQSPSPFWSGSAGAIYPLIGRLEKRGLLSSRRQAGDARGGRLYSLTARGVEALREWLAPPLPEWAAGVPVDPLRTRLLFLGALSAPKRAAFVEEARAALEIHIAAVRDDSRAAKAEGDLFHHLGARGALAVLLARRRWLKEVSKVLGAKRGGRAGRGAGSGAA